MTTHYIRRNNPKQCFENITNEMRRQFKESDKDIKVTIEPDNETRRNKQNALLWLWTGELAKHIETHQGEIFDTADIHEYVAGKLLPRRAVTINGEPEIMRTRTSKLKVKEFADFLTRYEMWAAETYQCFFTKPDDLYTAALMKEIEQQESDGL